MAASALLLDASGKKSCREDHRPRRPLARAAILERDWWTPTAGGYFEHVSKARRPKRSRRLHTGRGAPTGHGQEGRLVTEAERLAAGTGGLPAMLGRQEADAQAQAIASEPEAMDRADTAGDAETEDSVVEQAVA